MITHPGKVLFPDDGITKGELADYYEAIAPVMLPHLRGRPLTMERYPGGIGAKGFWQKDVSKGFPAWLQRVEVPKKDGVVHHPVVNRREQRFLGADVVVERALAEIVGDAELVDARGVVSALGEDGGGRVDDRFAARCPVRPASGTDGRFRA